MNTNKHEHLTTMLALAALLALGACADTQGPRYSGGQGTVTPASQGNYAQTGVVQSIELVQLESTGIGGSGIRAGAIVGAVVGGIVGSQIGKGDGNTAATVIGAAGGAYAGNQIEKRSAQGSDAYRIIVRMSDGSHQALTQSTSGDLRVGDRVHVANGVAQRY